jgi:3-methyl-2-oxobutanoate hydroxymethyltransferase
VASQITAERSMPTIGIGAGAGTSGQVLVLSDLLGLDNQFQPRFVRRYAEGHGLVRDAVNAFSRDVRGARFPAREEVLA